MTTIRSAHKRKAVRGFKFASFRGRVPVSANRATVLAVTGATSDRILANTPILQSLYLLLKRPIP